MHTINLVNTESKLIRMNLNGHFWETSKCTKFKLKKVTTKNMTDVSVPCCNRSKLVNGTIKDEKS